MDGWLDGWIDRRGGQGWRKQPVDSSVLPEVSLVDGQCPLEAGGAVEAGETARLSLNLSPLPLQVA